MSKFYQKFLILSFLAVSFIRCCLPEITTAQQTAAVDVVQIRDFPKLDFKRIEQKCLYFQKLANRSKNFRKTVYISSAVAAVGLLTYLGIKFFWKSEKKEDKSNVSLEKEKLDTLLNSIDRVLKSQKKDFYKLDFANLFKLGVSNGFYYGLSTVVVTSFLGVQAGLFNVLKDKFVELWKGQVEENFLNAVNLLSVNIKQLHLFFESWDLLDDEDELKENYALFIDCMENLIALATQSTLDLLPADSPVQQSILNLRDILCAKILDFSEELQQFLAQKPQDDKEEINQAKLDSVKISFKHLGDQIGRFVNLYYSALYEA